MAIAHDFPYLRSNFNVEIDGIPNVNPVIEVIPPGGHAEIVLYRDGRSPDRFRPLRGIVTLEPVTLRRGFNGQLDLFQWWQECAPAHRQRGGPSRSTFSTKKDRPSHALAAGQRLPVEPSVRAARRLLVGAGRRGGADRLRGLRLGVTSAAPAHRGRCIGPATYSAQALTCSKTLSGSSPTTLMFRYVTPMSL